MSSANELAERLSHIRACGGRIANEQANSKGLRQSLVDYYPDLPKLNTDGITGVCYLVDLNCIVYLRPVRKNDGRVPIDHLPHDVDDDGKILDFTVTFQDAPCIHSQSKATL